MEVGVLGFGVGLFSVETDVLDALAEGEALGIVEELGEKAFAAVGFWDEDRADPPDLVILVGEKHGGDGLAMDFFYESLAVVGLDEVLDGSFHKVRIEFFILGFESHIDHECSHGFSIVFFGDLQHG